MPDFLPTLTNFGAAGLIAWMWLAERRSASARERHLTEAHDRLMEGRASIESLLTALTTNTRALTALELGQRAMTRLVERATDFGFAKSVSPNPHPPDPRGPRATDPRSGSVHPSPRSHPPDTHTQPAD